MALLKSIASGNFTSASTWALCTAVNETSSSGVTLTTTSYITQSASTYSSTVNANATGVLLKLGTRSATPSGTFTAALLDNAGTVLAECTMNVTDIAGSSLPTAGTGSAYGHWVFFKFNTPIAITSGTFYRVAFKSSVAGSVGVHRPGTGTTVAAIVTDITQAPAATDRFIIVGDNNASPTNPGTTAGTKTAYTVTMNNTTTTQFGDGIGTTASIPYWSLYVGDNATLNYGNVAGVNYNLRVRGNVAVGSGGDLFPGTFNMGTVANPIQRTTTATLEIDSAVAGNHVFMVQGGVFVAQGLSRTIGKNVDRCLLSVDASVITGVLTVDTDTGWLNGDQILVGQTSRSTTTNLSDSRTLNADATATGLPIGSGLSGIKEGNSTIQSAIVLVTRNVNITAVSSSLQFYANVIGSTSVVDCDWVRFRWCGANLTNKQAFYLDANADNLTFNNCVFDTGYLGLSWSTASGGGLITDCTFSQCVVGIQASTATKSTTTLNNVWMIGNTSAGFSVRDLNFSVTGLRIVGSATNNFGLGFSSGSTNLTSPVTWSNILIHSCSQGIQGVVNEDIEAFTLDNLEIQRCTVAGFQVGLASAPMSSIVVNNSKFWGNNARNIYVQSAGGSAIFRNCYIASQSANLTTSGLEYSSVPQGIITFENCQFGTGFTGALTHTQDILIPSITGGNVFLRNCLLGSTTEVSMPGIQRNTTYVISENHDQVVGAKKNWYKSGLITSDNAIARTGTRSLRLTPNSAIGKLEYIFAKTAVANGATPTVGVYVRKSVVGDGAAYNGSQPRLIVRRNILVGITADTVIATATSASNGNWELLTGALPTLTGNGVIEIEVDCDGTAGWVNIDDFQPPSPVDSKSFSYSDDTLGVVSYGDNSSKVFDPLNHPFIN